MPRQVTSIFRRLGNAIREFTIAQRTVAIIGVAVLVLGASALGMWVSKPAYTPLFTGLSGEDASSIVDQLTADGVGYELADGGASILVPEADVYAERIKAAAAGLPSSSTGGYSLLDTMGVTSSEFQQSVTYKRALEGELAQTIGAMEGVQAASVQLAIPKDSVFVSEKNAPTASVFVQPRNGATLSNDQVQAIVHLTSASIDGMKATDVAVIDSAGTVLSAVGVGATGSAGQQASDYETGVQSAVQAMLDKVVGVGNATVVVAADLTTESASRVEESFTTPVDAPALNESVATENYTGTGGAAAGVLGTDTAATGAATDGNGTFTSGTTTKNNAVNKVTENRTVPAGAIRRQTISVAVDAAAAGTLNVANITSLVSSAAGVDAVRGDAVTVEVVPFSTAEATAAADALKAATDAAAAESLSGIIRAALIALGVIAAIVISLVFYARRSRRQSRESVEIGELSQAQSMLGGTGGVGAITGPNANPSNSSTVGPGSLFFNPSDLPTQVIRTVNFEPTEADIRRGEIDALAQNDPRGMAEQLRGLMDERENA